MSLKVIEIVSITYCDAANLGCGCEDDAAIPIPGENSSYQTRAVSAMTGHAPVIGLVEMKVMRRTKVPRDPKPTVGFYGRLSSSDALVLNIR